MFDALATLLVFDLAGLTQDTCSALHSFVMDVAKILVLLTTVSYLMGWHSRRSHVQTSTNLSACWRIVAEIALPERFDTLS